MTNSPDPDTTPQGPAYEGRLLARPDDDVVDQGAGFDLATAFSRRRVLGLLGIGAGALTLAACGSTSAGSSSASTTAASATTTGEIPEETNGPYPADGSDSSLNVLDDSGIVRSDITTNLGGGASVAGVPLSLTFVLTDMVDGDAPFEGAAVYVWQCNAAGQYSLYSSGVEDDTFLRGIQVADAEGEVTFTTIVPGCYPGRWPHIHVEVYPDAASASEVSHAIATSQVAFPEALVRRVFAGDAYAGSTANLDSIGSIGDDMVFGDGHDLEMPTFTGSVARGYTATLPVAIDTSTSTGAGVAGGGGGAGATPPSGGPAGGGTPLSGAPGSRT